MPVPQIIGYYIKRNMAVFLRPGSGVEETANAVHTYALDGKPPNEYDVFRNPDLAHTYEMIAQGGRDAFYDGPIAQTIDAYFKRIGGWLSAEDLREQHAEWIEAAGDQLSRRGRVRDGREYPGAGDAADAEHHLSSSMCARWASRSRSPACAGRGQAAGV